MKRTANGVCVWELSSGIEVRTYPDSDGAMIELPRDPYEDTSDIVLSAGEVVELATALAEVAR